MSRFHATTLKKAIPVAVLLLAGALSASAHAYSMFDYLEGKDPEPKFGAPVIPEDDLYLVNTHCPKWETLCRGWLDTCYMETTGEPKAQRDKDIADCMEGLRGY